MYTLIYLPSQFIPPALSRVLLPLAKILMCSIMPTQQAAAQ